MRRVLHLVASLLLAVSVLVAASWGYSYARTHHAVVFLRPSGLYANAGAGTGGIHVQWTVYSEEDQQLMPPGRFLFSIQTGNPGRLMQPAPFWRSIGFNFYKFPNDPGHRLDVPHWFVLLLTAPLPAWHFARVLRRGRCPRCGYDLTANATGVCPECGLAVPAAEPAPTSAAHDPGTALARRTPSSS